MHIRNSICIERIKGIKHLNFPVPEEPGVYLLVGSNGAGKTTILTSLFRICSGNALHYGFHTAAGNSRIDRYEKSAITYTSKEGKSATFRKREKKWVSTPKSNEAILRSFGFKSACFIKADSKRFSPGPEEIRQGNLVEASAEIKEALNILFSTNKYEQLFRLKISNGRGKNSTYFYVVAEGRQSYYSEKRFSSGELAMLRLVEHLTTVEENTLILLDEAELALHPIVQVRLLEYLRKMATQKKLTVIVSTHSTSMIRVTRPAHILLLEKEQQNPGHYRMVSPCYPAYAMGVIDEPYHHTPDALCCVEDEMAYLVLQQLLAAYNRLGEDKYAAQIERRILPVGGYQETLHFLDNASQALFRKTTGLLAVLDADVFDEKEKDHRHKMQLLSNYSGRVFNLGVTPELAMVNILERFIPEVQNTLRNRYHIRFEHFVHSAEYSAIEGKNARKFAKKKLELLCKEIGRNTGISRQDIERQLVELTFPHMYSEAEIRSFATPIANATLKPTH